MTFKIGIIGGKGEMGKWLTSFFQSKHIEVSTSDVGTSPSNRELTSTSDIIFLSVPMKSAKMVIDEIADKLNPNKLLVDIFSLKLGMTDYMLSKTNAELLSLHPMFGPTVTSISEQVVVSSKLRAGEKSDWLLSLLASEGAKIVAATPEEHDLAMASVQGLNHVNALLLASVFRSQNISVLDTLKFASPVYRLRLGVTARILGQDPKLYADIAINNPHVLPLIKALHMETGKWLTRIEKKDHAGFEEEFKLCAEHFSEFLKPARKESGVLIDALADYLKNSK